jgi:hypothetical protein
MLSALSRYVQTLSVELQSQADELRERPPG